MRNPALKHSDSTEQPEIHQYRALCASWRDMLIAPGIVADRHAAAASRHAASRTVESIFGPRPPRPRWMRRSSSNSVQALIGISCSRSAKWALMYRPRMNDVPVAMMYFVMREYMELAPIKLAKAEAAAAPGEANRACGAGYEAAADPQGGRRTRNHTGGDQTPRRRVRKRKRKNAQP